MKSPKGPPYFLKALGRKDLPETAVIAGKAYKRVLAFKHDFFAATGLYESGGEKNEKVVLKIGRTEPLFGIPLLWLGCFLAKREMAVYRRLAGVKGVPSLTGPWGKTGFAHAYVEGDKLKAGDVLNDFFFPGLAVLVSDLHLRDIAYADLEKRENVIVSADGKAYLIDFQISWYWPWRLFGRFGPGRWILWILKRSDRYHLMKHWRRHRPDQLPQDLIDENRAKPLLVRIHTLLFRPVTMLRRRLRRRLDPAAGDSLKRSGV